MSQGEGCEEWTGRADVKSGGRRDIRGRWSLFVEWRRVSTSFYGCDTTATSQKDSNDRKRGRVEREWPGHGLAPAALSAVLESSSA